ncbi:hypothetical protein GCM10007897_41520 [Sphingobium jiangsuense]|uniref:Uncharacterized protein n=1 Tax=Sphingobium jiangsuense TaxID=870476 RepID=A0A7W6BMY3_9SPHN|nr:hypothetical protein [Sphingobium jiangsuense]MBB3928819.1 hypothetical protein [Sphingobium jiangsuense]GLT02730.1 hypothetical protein GCM10007897_41520 [Sphingobium jiangsuense]
MNIMNTNQGALAPAHGARPFDPAEWLNRVTDAGLLYFLCDGILTLGARPSRKASLAMMALQGELGDESRKAAVIREIERRRGLESSAPDD